MEVSSPNYFDNQSNSTADTRDAVRIVSSRLIRDWSDVEATWVEQSKAKLLEYARAQRQVSGRGPHFNNDFQRLPMPSDSATGTQPLSMTANV